MKFLITAGPTQEPIDPVRYLSNRSSGKMGYAIAEAAVKAGHQAVLISGPTGLDIPDGTDYIPVETAREMEEAVQYWIKGCEVAIMTAAVSDYRMDTIAPQKLKKQEGVDTLTLELVKNPDILANIRKDGTYDGILVGFAAETENLIKNAQAKLERKGCDMILANDVSKGQVFGSDKNTLYAVYSDTVKELGTHSKQHLAHIIISLCEKMSNQRDLRNLEK